MTSRQLSESNKQWFSVLGTVLEHFRIVSCTFGYFSLDDFYEWAACNGQGIITITGVIFIIEHRFSWNKC